MSNYLPASLAGNSELYRRALVVEKLSMLPVECIARGYLTGSGWAAYKKNPENPSVCGIPLPFDLHDGSKLPQPIFTPTTKAEQGHDEHIRTESVNQEFGTWLGLTTLSLYQRAQEYAEPRGIIIADTKFEFGNKLGDEVLTPDSSRFWDVQEYEQAQALGKSPSGYDKEPVRQVGKKAEINGQLVDISLLDPTKQEHVQLVVSWDVPKEVIEQTTYRYLTIVERLTGLELSEFQAKVMEA
jgi:phosphoribosylaminoimidazole-succinocarboxamide synthase